MKVALVYPQVYQPDPCLDPDWEEPIGLGYIGAVAQQAGHDTRLFIPNESMAELTLSVIDWKPDVVGYQVYTCQVPDILTSASEVKRQLPQTLVVAGGPHPSAIPMVKPIDLNIIGEGELTFQELLTTISGGQDYCQVRGVAYQGPGGEIILSGQRERADLESLPFPIRLDPRTYHYTPGSPRSLFYPPPSKCTWASMVTSRGCTNWCKFCSSPSFWKGCVKFRSLESVIDEIRFIQQEYGVNLIFFEDLTFALNRAWVEALCRKIIAERIQVSWWCQTSVASADTDLFALMRQAGCRTIAFGIEGLNDQDLRRMGKRQVVSGIEKALGMAVEAGMMTWAYYIIGFPWETEDTIMENAQHLVELPAHRLRLSIATPLPGSAWYSEFRQEDLNPDWGLYDTNHLVYNHPTLTPAKAKELQSETFRMFYGSSAYADRVSRFTSEYPELSDSFKQHLAYVKNFL